MKRYIEIRVIFSIFITFLVVSSAIAEPVTVKIFDSEVKLSMRSKWKQTFKFADGDTIFVKISILKGDNISKFELRRWNGNAIISRVAKEEINEKYYNPKETVYTFFLENSAWLQYKTYKISIYRTTLHDSLIDFDVTFKADTVYDTTFIEVLNATHELASGMGAIMGYDDKIEIQFQLPEECTGDICFVIGTKESVNKMWNTLKVATDALGVVKLNPLQAILVGVIANIPEITSSEGYIKYYLVDSENLKKYRNEQKFNCIKWGENVTVEVARVCLKEELPPWQKPKAKYYYFVIVNPAMGHGRIVTIRATTMKIKQTIIPK